MANYATNIFYASTENQNDLNKIEAFLDDNFSCYANKYGNSVDAEFPSRWEYPEKEMDQLVAGKSSVSCPLKPSDSAIFHKAAV